MLGSTNSELHNMVPEIFSGRIMMGMGRGSSLRWKLVMACLIATEGEKIHSN